MFKLGMIGAENSHSIQISTLCNVEKVVPVRVPILWGEAPKYSKITAERGQIPEVVDDWREMLGKVDGVMIDHRHPEAHYEPAKFFIENGVPAFVDKPFTHSLRTAKHLLDLAEKGGVPVMSFSAIPVRPPFQEFRREVEAAGVVRAVNSNGPVDLKSRWGGVFFYGIHQVDAIIELLGANVRNVVCNRNHPNGVLCLMYPEGVVATINCLKKGGGGFHWRVCTDNGILFHPRPDAKPATENPYIKSAQLIHDLLKNGKSPFSRERMLAPIAVLEAAQKSLDKGGIPVKVAKF